MYWREWQTAVFADVQAPHPRGLESKSERQSAEEVAGAHVELRVLTARRPSPSELDVANVQPRLDRVLKHELLRFQVRGPGSALYFHQGLNEVVSTQRLEGLPHLPHCPRAGLSGCHFDGWSEVSALHDERIRRSSSVRVGVPHTANVGVAHMAGTTPTPTAWLAGFS
jgi:hypothetical protein